MFSNIKEMIKELAYQAVRISEETLASSTGKEKKLAAIEYIVTTISVPPMFKSIVTFLLSKFIDEAVEKAVEYMHSIQNN